MSYIHSLPPKPTGDSKKDIEALNKWCGVLLQRLRCELENSNTEQTETGKE